METRTPNRPLYRNPYLIYFVAGVVLLTLLRLFWPTPEVPAPLMRGGAPITVPSFQLIDSTGDPFQAEDMDGHVTIVSFFFTRCKSICPWLTQAVKTVQDRLDEDGVEPSEVRILSISVDPEYDRPERLREYAEQHGMDPDRWTLLTGDRDQVKALVEKGFMTGMGERTEPTAGLIDIAHSSRLILVDRRRAIRGYYKAEGNEKDLLVRHAETLARHPDL